MNNVNLFILCVIILFIESFLASVINRFLNVKIVPIDEFGFIVCDVSRQETKEIDIDLLSLELRLERIIQKVAIRRYIKNLFNDLQTVKFNGIDPMTGRAVTVIFNEPTPGRQSLISFNHLTDCYFYSEDAGLTWQKVKPQDFVSFLEMADCII